jgi:YVTN family beta-propeller protein
MESSSFDHFTARLGTLAPTATPPSLGSHFATEPHSSAAALAAAASSCYRQPRVSVRGDSMTAKKGTALIAALAAVLISLLTPSPARAETVRIYVTNSAGDSVHVIDPTTHRVVQVIDGIETVRPCGSPA